MNYRLLSKLIGLLLLLLSCAMLACLIFAYLDNERTADLDAVDSLFLSFVHTAAIGGLLLYLGRQSGKVMLRKEAIAVVGLGWLVSAAFGALPYVFCEPGLSPVRAFFESMSGFTTTGATVIANLETLPRGILLWRALTQWLGGLGILVLFVALLSSVGVGSKALFQHESSAGTSGGVQARIQDVAARLWQIYLALSVICCLGLMALGMSPYEAICHAMTTISTGGFSTRDASIAAFDSLGIELWLFLFMTLGGISFMLYAWLLRRRWNRWKSEEEAKLFLVLLAAFIVVIAADLVLVEQQHSPGSALRESAFQVVSIMTTTGFATQDFDQWPELSRLLLLLMMIIGGCAGSTAGGIKLSRWIVFARVIRQQLVRSFRPNQVFTLRLNGSTVDSDATLQTVFFIALAGVAVALGTILVSLIEPSLDIETCLSAVLASLFNIGPGLAAVGPTCNFAHLSDGTLGLLSWLMLLGRLEFFSVLVLLVPTLWKDY